MKQTLVSLLLASSAAIASPLQRSSRKSPTVHIHNGTVTGVTKSGIDNFYGIPFVEPPVGRNRLRAPRSFREPFGHLQLPTTLADVTACVQQNMDPALTRGLNNASALILESIGGNFTGKMGEDCLTINIQRPAALPNDAYGSQKNKKKLPVLFWIYGGGWEIGTTQFYDATRIIQISKNMSEPILFVAPNYRVNAYGFLNGKEIQEAGISNLGLRDQRKALEWVADNIEAFGGDPDRVTIWGESAGAASVFDHMLITNGDHNYKGKPLFHGAMMNSGTYINLLDTVSHKAQTVFDTFAKNAGCSPTDKGSKTVDCLREIPEKKFQAAMNSLPNFSGPDSNNLAYIRRIDRSSSFLSNYPEDALREGKFAHVPIISGNLQDEATIFAPSSRKIVNSTETLIDYFATWWTETPRKLISEFIATYPDTPSTGLPAGTPDKYELYPQFKRNAAIQTDVTFGGARRVVLQSLNKVVPTWSFLATFLHLDHDVEQFGTYHTSDLGTQFGLQYPITGRNMNEAYIHFVNYLDPNGANCEKPWWPKWDSKSRLLVNFSRNDVGLTRDDFREDSIEFLAKHGSRLRQ